MKILAGKLKGKNIEARKDRSLRPTKSFIREVIFNLLQHGKFLYDDDFIVDDNPSLIQDRLMLDIFCGTGALGLEAISRGAERVIFMDQNAETLRLARHNAQALKVEGQCKYLRSDSTDVPLATQPVDVVFMDPPYHLDLAKKSLKSLAQKGWLRRGTVIVLEQGKTDDVPELDGFSTLLDRIKDKTRISVLQYLG